MTCTFDYFKLIGDSILQVSSKSDMLLFDAIKEKDWNELYESVLALHCFHLAVFRCSNDLLTNFLEKTPSSGKTLKKDRKELGAYFTPPYIAEYIVKETISPLIDKILIDETIKDKCKAILKLNVCDPAVGGGVFLIAAHNLIMSKLIQVAQKEHDLSCLASKSAFMLYGVDINIDAVEIAKLMVNLNIARWALKDQMARYGELEFELPLPKGRGFLLHRG